jgi:uncharacterized coiled-coil DUF342 family protein
MSEQAEIKALREEIAQLREEVLKTRAEIDAVDDWANGLQLVWMQVLPLLLHEHPKAHEVRDCLALCAQKYEQLLAHPEQAEDGHERAGMYESAKRLHGLLTLLNQGEPIRLKAFGRRRA